MGWKYWIEQNPTLEAAIANAETMLEGLPVGSDEYYETLDMIEYLYDIAANDLITVDAEYDTW